MKPQDEESDPNSEDNNDTSGMMDPTSTLNSSWSENQELGRLRLRKGILEITSKKTSKGARKYKSTRSFSRFLKKSRAQLRKWQSCISGTLLVRKSSIV